MSGWNAYITSLTDSTSSIKRASIFGLDASVWARSEGENKFKATEDELKKLISFFDNLKEVPSVGVDLEKVHYIVPFTEDNLIFGKKDKSGFIAVKIKTAIIVGIFEGESAAGSEARFAVEKIASFLSNSGY